MPKTKATGSMKTSAGVRMLYVLDTSVLLSDPRAMYKFGGNDVLIPLVVVSELEGKRHDPELGYFARAALRSIEGLRVEHGNLSRIPVGEEGGTLTVKMGTISSNLPHELMAGDNDSKIIAAAYSVGMPELVKLVSKDLPMRIRATAIGVTAEDYLNNQVEDSGWTGVAEFMLAPAEMDILYRTRQFSVKTIHPVNTCLTVKSMSGNGHALARVTDPNTITLVDGDKEVFGLRGHSAEQRFALDLLTDPSVGIVSLGGRAGTGKSALALCAGLEAVLERHEHKKVIIFRPLYAVGGQDLGFLPGNEEEKMGPWGQAVYDVLGSIASENVMKHITEQKLVEVLPLTHIRGRSLNDAYVIVDEAQSLEKNVLLTVMSRIGQNSKIVLTHDVAQRDNLHVGRHDGVAAVVEILKGQELFGHVTLTRSERSRIAELVTDMLDLAEL